jgi:hypothetical protein
MIEPRPTILFVCCSVLVITGCVLGVASILGSLSPNADFCTLLGIVIFVPFPTVLGIQQYRATFRRAPGPAKFTAVFLYVLAAFGGFGYVTNVGEAVLKKTNVPFWWWAFVLWPLLAASLVSLFLGWQNSLWFTQLKKFYADSGSDPPRGTFSLRELFLAVTVIAIIAGLSMSYFRNDRPSAAEHVSPEQAGLGLPEGASDVSYGRGHRGTMAYEFTTDEASFRNWVEAGIGSLEAQAANVPLVEITQPVEIQRYTVFARQFRGAEQATVSDGLEYEWSYKDRGIQAVFDRKINRAYVSEHYH